MDIITQTKPGSNRFTGRGLTILRRSQPHFVVTFRRLVLEGSMEQRIASNSPNDAPGAVTSQAHHHEGRGTWVLTAYGISGLALFGVLIYYFSVYVTR
jgi:hypothetical protein